MEELALKENHKVDDGKSIIGCTPEGLVEVGDI